MTITELIQANRLADIKQQYAKSPSLLNPPPNEEYPLITAVRHGRKDIVRWLLQQAIDVNKKGDENNTALHIAAEEGEPELAQLLLEHGADIEAKGAYGRTPLQSAVMNGRRDESLEVANVLLSAGAKYDLHTAVRLGRTDKVRELLENDSTAINKAPLPGDLLESAIQAGSGDLVTLLLRHGVSPDVSQSMGRPPIFSAIEIAVNLGNFDPLLQLLQHGVKTDVFNTHGDSLKEVINLFLSSPQPEPVNERIQRVSQMMSKYLH